MEDLKLETFDVAPPEVEFSLPPLQLLPPSPWNVWGAIWITVRGRRARDFSNWIGPSKRPANWRPSGKFIVGSTMIVRQAFDHASETDSTGTEARQAVFPITLNDQLSAEQFAP